MDQEEWEEEEHEKEDQMEKKAEGEEEEEEEEEEGEEGARATDLNRVYCLKLAILPKMRDIDCSIQQ